jgi:glutathione S-transferase
LEQTPLTATLFAIPASHPCAAIEAALTLKGVDHRRIDMIPVLAKPLQYARFRGFTVPGVEFTDGRRVLGSRAIVRALEHIAPEPPLLPLDGRERRRVEEAEQWADEVLQPLVRRIVWAALRRDPSATTSYSARARLPVPAPVARLSAPLVAQAAGSLNGASDPNVRSDLINLDFHLARADDWIEKRVLGGERVNAADLQVAASVRLLLTIEDVVPRVAPHPVAQLARRLFPDYPGLVPAGTLPPQWLTARPPSEL